MTTLRKNQALGAYIGALKHHRRSLELAGRDVAQSWLEAWFQRDSVLSSPIDRALQASVALLQVQADGQRELLRQGGAWLSAWHLACQRPWPQDSAIWLLLQISDVSSGSLAKVNRQVGYFAVTRWGSAALEAQRTATAYWLRGDR